MEQTKIKRKYHHYNNWECYKAGFYEPASSLIDGKERYREFLSRPLLFSLSIERVFNEWPNSCEHFLTNNSINRVAWIGQASMCISSGISSFYRGGFLLLTQEQQTIANDIAKTYLNRWLNEYASKNREIH